ncbi:hypothetical protein PENSPDRAFT_681416 [Peniophora sp. CONT]|nr:hypothetical protein PENSPDRAFT_681416 [Peniophora sp. CONT]
MSRALPRPHIRSVWRAVRSTEPALLFMSSSDTVDGIPVALLPLLEAGWSTFYMFRATVFVSLASITFLIYDHVLTFGDEVEYVWKAPRNITKYLFLFNRYTVPIVICICMRAFTGVQSGPLSNELFACSFNCKVWSAVSIAISPISIANGSFIVLLRLWNIWDRRMKLLLPTFALFVLTQCVTVAMAIRLAVKDYGAPPATDEHVRASVDRSLRISDSSLYFSYTRTCVFPHKISYVSLWAPAVGFEVIIFAVTWWNALSRPRTNDIALARQLYWDGSIVFFVVFTLRLMNMVISIVAPLSMTMLGLYFVWSANTVTVSHLVLNLRKVAVEQMRVPALGDSDDTPTDDTLPIAYESPTMTSTRSLRSQELPGLQSSWGTDMEMGDSYELRSQLPRKSSV